MQVVLEVGKKFPTLTGPSSDAFAEELIRLEDSDFEEVVLDLNGTESISSMAMGSIFASFQKLEEQKRSLKIVGANSRIQRLLQMVNMSHLIEVND